MLAEEFGLPPSEETIALYRRIQAGEVGRSPAGESVAVSATAPIPRCGVSGNGAIADRCSPPSVGDAAAADADAVGSLIPGNCAVVDGWHTTGAATGDVNPPSKICVVAGDGAVGDSQSSAWVNKNAAAKISCGQRTGTGGSAVAHGAVVDGHSAADNRYAYVNTESGVQSRQKRP